MKREVIRLNSIYNSERKELPSMEVPLIFITISCWKMKLDRDLII
jgi:hypothetical protein